MAQQGDDLTQQALSYVRYQATKGTRSLAALMERTAPECARCLEGVSEEQAAFKPGSEWSIKEIVAHLVSVGAATNQVIQSLALGEEPPPDLGEAEPAADRPIDELRRDLAQMWEETCRLAASLPESGGLERTFPHPFFGPLNFREWLAFQRLHAMDHVQQIEEVKAAPGYPGG